MCENLRRLPIGQRHRDHVGECREAPSTIRLNPQRERGEHTRQRDRFSLSQRAISDAVVGRAVTRRPRTQVGEGLQDQIAARIHRQRARQPVVLIRR